MTIAVDFDGTIVEHKYPLIGREKPFAIDTLRQLRSEGHKIILWTVREGDLLDEAVKFCHERGLDFYAVNADFPNSAWNDSAGSRKLKADIYIDDRNLGGLPEWPEIYQAISAGLHANGKHKKKRCWFKRIIDRTREARRKYNR